MSTLNGVTQSNHPSPTHQLASLSPCRGLIGSSLSLIVHPTFLSPLRPLYFVSVGQQRLKGHSVSPSSPWLFMETYRRRCNFLRAAGNLVGNMRWKVVTSVSMEIYLVWDGFVVLLCCHVTTAVYHLLSLKGSFTNFQVAWPVHSFMCVEYLPQVLHGMSFLMQPSPVFTRLGTSTQSALVVKPQWLFGHLGVSVTTETAAIGEYMHTNGIKHSFIVRWWK